MIKRIFWDKGHGGNDPGAVGNGLLEKVLNGKIVEYAMAYLTANYTNFVQRTSRTADQTLTLAARATAANNFDADVCVSVHINAGGGNGYESYIYNNLKAANKPAAAALQKALNSEILAAMKTFGNIKAHGGIDARAANFAMVRDPKMPAVLTENLYIDSSDHKYLKNEAFLKAVGEAHARGVAKFLQLPSKKPATTTQPATTTTQVVYYTVVRGDTLSRIAKTYNTTVAAIQKLNTSIKDVNKISIGQKIRVK